MIMKTLGVNVTFTEPGTGIPEHAAMMDKMDSFRGTDLMNEKILLIALKIIKNGGFSPLFEALKRGAILSAVAGQMLMYGIRKESGRRRGYSPPGPRSHCHNSTGSSEIFQLLVLGHLLRDYLKRTHRALLGREVAKKAA
jgi:hypothetical protein